MAIAVVTDSTADITPDIARKLEITVVPLNVHFGEETYRDGVDLDAGQFFERLQRSPILPTTSQPSAGAFAEVYNRLAKEAEGIVSIHISAKLSGTYSSALLGREALDKAQPVEIIDSLQASMGMGLIVITAAEASRAGAKLEEVVKLVHQTMPRTHLLLFVDTLEYLQRGGRIGKAQAFLGSLLNVKPLLTIREGEIHPVERVRTRAKALERLLDFMMGFPRAKDVAILHSTSPGEAEELKQRVCSIAPQAQVYLAKYGPVIGTHLGPGAMGVFVVEGET